MSTCPHCQRPTPPDMAHICTGHLTPARESHPEIMRRVRATVVTAVRLLDGNLYDHAAARAHLARLLKEIEDDES